ncbi:MAG: hypothetical protein GY866_27735 [Proteobacteria bacterium]|nr:hypothetical protein [Pseudomonadota bacterium]
MFLTYVGKKRIYLRVLVLGAILLVSPISARIGLAWGEKRDIKQSHRVHVREEKMVCDDCHVASEKDAEGSGLMPKQAVCADCHEQVEDKANQKGCLFCHDVTLSEMAEIKNGEKKVAMRPVTHRSLVDSHKTHGEIGYGCQDCHGNIDFEGDIPFPSGKYLPKARQCFDCHEKELQAFSVSENCAQCHKPNTYDRFQAPVNHADGWKSVHGAHAMVQSDTTHGRDCGTCHEKTDCVACHETEAPKDHTVFFRTRGHGIVSAGFRERCLTCHRQDSCLSCHQETAPRSHRGNWENRIHCLTCHLDSNSSLENNCSICHRKPAHLEGK